jgi:hypothetical protein
MLGTLLDRLGGFFSKSFVIASLFPVLLAGVLNGLMLHEVSPAFRQWVSAYAQATGGVLILQGVIVAIALAVLAFVVSSLSRVLREVLEGRHGPRHVRERLIEEQTTCRDGLESDARSLKLLRRGLKEVQQNLKSRLDAAGQKGYQFGTCCYTRVMNGPLQDLVNARRRQRAPTHAEVEAAIVEIESALSFNNSALQEAVPNTLSPSAQRLAEDRDELVDLVTYAIARAEFDWVHRLGERARRFGGVAVLPTALGNVAESVASYAESRYGINIDARWIALQKAMQADSVFYATVQDAKAQLDFLVAFWWAVAASGFAWGVILPFQSRWELLLLVVSAAPILCVGTYRLALNAYLALADLMKSGVDLFRFDLLKALRMPLPRGTNEEQQVWEQLDLFSEFGEDRGVRYQHAS